ncbi:MAG: amidohydrolase [Betaproteobacteria bacterium]|nr:amidohydrolase [Betaproteobacteria bacterium]
MQLISAQPAVLPWMNAWPCACCLPGRQSAAIFTAMRAAGTKIKSGARKKAKAASKPAGPRRIDVHHHFAPPGYVKDLGAENLFNGSPGSRAATYDWTPKMSLDDMDKGGTQTAITSVYSASHIANHPEARRIARQANEYAAQMGRDYPGRFGSFAVLPMPDVEGSLREIEYALDVLKADGVFMMTSYGNKWLGDTAFTPVFEELNRRKCMVYTHPHGPDATEGILPGIPPSVIEFATDTTRTIASVLFSGNATRFPDVKYIFSHAGGVMPFILERFTRVGAWPNQKSKFPRGALHEIKKFYYEIAQASHPYAMSSLKSFMPISQILFGTDFPYRSTADMGKGLVKSGFSAREIASINHGNAAKLFPRFA